MTKQEAIAYFGGVPELAKTLGVRRQAIYQWGPFVPEGRAYQLELLTGGALKARPESGEPTRDRESSPGPQPEPKCCKED